ncbi:MAG: 4Fe-4S ferredoxin N-terminal domain-containing protein [Halanaeroarchaeum sp.]
MTTPTDSSDAVSDDGRYDLNSEEAKRILEGSEYDADLGFEMARDAVQVANGDLDEETFQERYHDAVVDEFGVDERPTGQGGNA